MSTLQGYKLYSILALKCPRCHRGNLYYKNNPYSWEYMDKMKKECDHCGQNFIREEGFYWGAMYVGYGVSTGLIFTILGLDLLLQGYVSYPVLYAAVLMPILLMPVIHRISRAIWINFFVHYDPDITPNSDKT